VDGLGTLNSTKVSNVTASACPRNPLRKQQAILEKIAAIPDVQSASFGNAIPMDDNGWRHCNPRSAARGLQTTVKKSLNYKRQDLRWR
jgi:hypothetical protein